ncbi:SIS domain-containing protein [Coriobacteriales bacterium OH1046]|nr:SIS domain-containing protein [Coriobacteriales bacterium OH1046]
MNSFLKEVLEQGDLLKRTVKFFREDKSELVERIFKAFIADEMDKVVLTGMGSSLYACDSVRSYLTSHGIPAVAFSSHELSRFQFGHITPKTLVIVISQSGNSSEVIELVEKAKKVTKIVGIYNSDGCKLQAIADFPLPIGSEKELSITSKTFENTMLILNIIAHRLTDELDAEFWADVDKVVAWCCDWIANYQKPSEEMLSFAKGVVLYDLLANDTSLATARQLSLAYREGLHNCAAVWELADYAHGQYHSSKMAEKYMAQIFNPILEEGTKDLKMLNFILDHGGKVMVYSNKPVPALDRAYAVSMPEVSDTLVPLAESVAAETFLALQFGPDWTKDH